MLRFTTASLVLPVPASSASASDYAAADRLRDAIGRDVDIAGDVRALPAARESDWYALQDWIGDFCSFNPLAQRPKGY